MKELSDREVWERSITEEDVFGACRTLLELNGARVHKIVERIPWGRKTSEPGIPDSSGWFYKPPLEHPGLVCPIHFWIEFKRPVKAVYRDAQVVWIENAVRDNVIAFFANSVQQMLEGFGRFGIKLKT